MSTKGREIGMKDQRGRSPSFPRKAEIGKRMRSPNTPSTLEPKKVSALESRKVPSHMTRPSAISSLDHSLAHNPKKQPSFNKIKPPRRSLDKPVPPFKLTSTRSKPNGKNVTRPSIKTTGSTKPKDIGKSRPPLRSKNSVNVNGKKQMKQPTKGLGSNVKVAEKKPEMFDAPSSSEADHNIVTHEEDNKTIPIVDDIEEDHNITTHEVDNKTNLVVDDILTLDDCDKQLLDDEDDDLLHGVLEIEDVGEIPLCDPSDPIGLGGDQDIREPEICSQDNVIMVEGSVDEEYTNEINHQDQVDETSDTASDQLPDPKVDQENEGVEIEQVAQELYLGSNDVEQVEPKDQEHEETTPKEPEHEEETEPKESESESEPEHEETEREAEPEHEETEPEPEDEESVMKEGGAEVPKEEEQISKMMVKNQQVVGHGKKDIAAYNDVIEETIKKLREQRKNKVKALVGAFETVITLESDAPQA